MGYKHWECDEPLFVLNGPNLNRLGRREPAIYGTTTLAEIEAQCRRRRRTSRRIPAIQWEGQSSTGSTRRSTPAADRHQSRGVSFTSIAILDALKMCEAPSSSPHLSNIHRREESYHACWCRRPPP